MSDDLSALLRAAALEAEAAARRDAPPSAETLGRYVRDVRRRRAADGVMLAVAGVVVLGGVVFGADRLAHAIPATPIGYPTAPSVTPMSTPSGFATPAPTPTDPATAPASTPPAPTAVPAPTGPAAPTTTPASPGTAGAPPTNAATAAPPVAQLPAPPGAVAIAYVGPGGGSGEVMVTWAPTVGATGYRVYRSDVAAGPFSLSATFDVATARTTVAYGGIYEAIQIWQPLTGDRRDIQYVEAINGGRAYFQVTAFNAGGEGPMSGVVCGEPQTGAPSTPCPGS